MIFLSYSWSNDEIANTIDSFFTQNEVTLKRDRRDLKYKQSIKEFMKSVRDSDFVIMIISQEYLQSKNCMYEVLEFVKDTNFRDKIIPIISSNSNIFDISNRISIQKYWTKKISELEEDSKGLDFTKSIPVIKELKEYKYIENEILDFIEVICDMNNIVLTDNNFNDIHFDTISSYIKIDNLKAKNIVLNIKTSENTNINSANIIEYLSNNHSDFQVYYLKENFMTFKFKTFKNEEEIEREVLSHFNTDVFEKFHCFNYENAYYIAGKKKMYEYRSKSIMWWSHFRNGYTENLKNAGLYSLIEVESIVKFMFGSLEKEHLAINAQLVDSLDLRVIPTDSEYSKHLIADSNRVYGIADWLDFDSY